jgi:hypothetical protein
MSEKTRLIIKKETNGHPYQIGQPVVADKFVHHAEGDYYVVGGWAVGVDEVEVIKDKPEEK